MQQLAESSNVADYAAHAFQQKRLLRIDQMLMAKPQKVGDETPTQAKALEQGLTRAWQHKWDELLADAKADPRALPTKASPTESQRKKKKAER
eukprot:924426-Alexandrium_andersonii.AAC.1